MDTHFSWLWINWLCNGKTIPVYFLIVSLYVYILAEIMVVEVNNI